MTRGAVGTALAGVTLVLAVSLTGCVGVNAPAAAPTPVITPGSPEDVAPDDTDYSVDAGNEQSEYEYEQEPPPAPSVTGLLCNLNQEFFRGLRSENGGVAQADDALRSRLVGLWDLVSELDSLRESSPESVPNIDAVQQIYAEWDQAVLSLDNGEQEDAARAMQRGEELLATLPASRPDGC